MMQIYHFEQGTPEWFAARMGVPTASEFKTIIGIKKDAKEKVTRDLYMRKLAGEIVTGEPMENYSNSHMDRGKGNEDEARDLYALTTGADPQRVGFIRNHNAGCSPDSLIEPNGGLEIKDALPHIHIDRLIRNELPSEHRAQVQGGLWIAEREWWDFCSHCRKLPLLVVRVHRDEEFITKLKQGVEQFNEELAALVEKIRRYGSQSLEAAA